jgi:dCTP deaminase
MILSSAEITRRLHLTSCDESLVISPYSHDCLQPASYDLKAAEDTVLQRGICTLVPSQEKVELPRDVAGTLMCRSSLGRKGVLIGAGYIDPGFRGNLTLCLTNMGKEEVLIKRNDRIVQMILHEVRNSAASYSGRYQDSNGAVGAR